VVEGFQESGVPGFEDRSSRPRRCPTKTPARVERRLVELRRRHKLGPARLAPKVGIPASTLHGILQRHGVSRLCDLDRSSGPVVRRAVAFWRRARDFFGSYGITVERVLTDNGACYRARIFDAELVQAAVVHTRTRPYRPQTNGKVERFNRTLLEEWAYARPYRSEAARTRALDTWLHLYNHHRHHTATSGPPVSRVNNLVGQNS
jgi:transposase InsO family protein